MVHVSCFNHSIIPCFNILCPPEKIITYLCDAYLVICFSEKFAEVFNKQRKEKMEREKERIQLMNADPFDPSVQSVIAEEIRFFNIIFA